MRARTVPGGFKSTHGFSMGKNIECKEFKFVSIRLFRNDSSFFAGIGDLFECNMISDEVRQEKSKVIRKFMVCPTRTKIIDKIEAVGICS